ncbi:hypothetical protein [Methanobrevibacter sp. DSM 116169]|uniref:hypothetical protein n=1 Tax=Methanobrevibacter sp. DSM 116169 TaxID=3242727 RepID=UPI0038FBEEC6
MNINFSEDEILYLKGDKGLVGIVKIAISNKIIYIGTPDNEEIAMFLEENDLIAISSFDNNEKAVKSLAYLTRETDAPIIVLDKNHPSSKRLPLVLSVGERVKLDCNIKPGTHPEQDILCSCDSLSGLIIEKTENGVKLNKDFKNYEIKEF